MKIWKSSLLLATLAASAAAQSISLQGLRSSASHGIFPSAAFAPNGNLFLLLDEQDGIRILKTDATGRTVLAESQMGAKGDSPVAMTIDPNGAIYVIGTTTSGKLEATQGVAFPNLGDNSTNSFLAKYDQNLHLVFLSFLGADRTAAASVAATSDAVFVAGITFNAAFPATATAVQPSPAANSSENGFVERFTTDGAQLIYATFLSGKDGSTIPSSIVADTSDNAYVTGSTTSTAFPTVAALQPTLLPVDGAISSGFLTRLNPPGTAFVFSTYIAGSGITSLAIDASCASLALTGNVALGQFPVATVLAPLVSVDYQSLLRIPIDGQSITSSIVLVPGTQSYVTLAPDGGTWISGALTMPFFPPNAQPDSTMGDSFLLHLTANGSVDRALHFGGFPVANAGSASLTTNVAAPALNASTVALPGSITVQMEASLLSTQHFDLPMAATPSSTLPSRLSDLAQTASQCGSNTQCNGAGALLAAVNPAASTPILSVSSSDLPNVTLRNLGPDAATDLTISASGFTLAGNCGTTLGPWSQCSLALTGSGPGYLTVSASNADTVSLPLPANTLSAAPIVLSASELDFGVVTSLDSTLSRTLTVTNLSAITKTFISQQESGADNLSYTLAETASDCPSSGSPRVHTLPSGATCQLSLGLTVASGSMQDASIRAAWTIGSHDVLITGVAQPSAIHLSAAQIDFGAEFPGSSPRLPRYLYLSNNSGTPLPHTSTSLPSGSPFGVIDSCPTVLQPHSVCQLKLSYLSSVAPSSDSTTLELDGQNVLITGTTMPATNPNGSGTNPALSVSVTSLQFPTPVVVTQISSTPQILTIANTGGASFPMALAVAGDFNLVSGCPAILAAGASCLLQVGFVPSQPGQRAGVLSVTAGSGFTPVYVSLTGTATPILPANDGTLDLGQTLQGEPVVLWYKVQQPIGSLTVASSSALFSVALVPDTGSGHGSLAAYSFSQTVTANCNNCWLGVQFFSQVAASNSATMVVTSTPGGNPYQITLEGVSLPAEGMLLDPMLRDFGSVAVHSSSSQLTFALTNALANGSASTVQSVTVTGDFEIAVNSSGGPDCIGSLASTASCFVQVIFAPTSTGDRTGSLTIVTSSGTVTAVLSGYGVADPGISISPTALVFSNTPGIAATQQNIVLANTGAEPLTVAAPTASNSTFSVTSNCEILQPGSTCNLTVTFTPLLVPVAATLSIPVTATTSGQSSLTSYSVALSGTYTTVDAGLQIVANDVNYGSTLTGAQGSAREFTVNNLTAKTLTLNFALPRQFPLEPSNTCSALASGSSCSFSMTFLPLAGGMQSGTVLVQGTPADGSAEVEALAYMQGYGTPIGSLKITGNTIPNSSIDFGQIVSGETAQQVLTLTNNGTGSLTVRRITSNPPFESTSTCGLTLAPNASCAVTLTYAPVDEVASLPTPTPRADESVLTIESDAISSPDILPLSGSVIPVVSADPGSPVILSSFTVSQGAISFPNTQVGDQSTPQAVTLTNTGTKTINIFPLQISTDFTASTTCAALLPGAICSFSVTFAPTAAPASTVRTGAMEIASDAGTSLEFITLLGTSAPASLTLNPATLDFGTINVGQSATLNVTVTNSGRLPITFLALNGSGDYAVSPGSCPANGSTLAVGNTCVLAVTFRPGTTGARIGTLSLANSATQLPLTVALTGNALEAQLQVTPGSLAFGGIDVGYSGTLTLTLLNTGSASVTGLANALSGANGADFEVTAPCLTTTLAPNQGCTETVTFIPSALGVRSATLTLTSSDPNGPATIALSAVGLKAGSFTLTANGATTATVTVASGSPATYALLLTPANGFTGSVALTCSPVIAGDYTSCSLLASTLTLGSAALGSTATIDTLTSDGGSFVVALSALLFAPFACVRRRRSRKAIRIFLLSAGCAGGFATLIGCGGPSQGNSKLKSTPAGTYQYQVTASSTSGAVVSSTVTLTLVVQ